MYGAVVCDGETTSLKRDGGVSTRRQDANEIYVRKRIKSSASAKNYGLGTGGGTREALSGHLGLRTLRAGDDLR